MLRDHLGYSLLTRRVESLAPFRIERPLKSLIYFCDLKSVALSFASFVSRNLEEFHIEA